MEGLSDLLTASVLVSKGEVKARPRTAPLQVRKKSKRGRAHQLENRAHQLEKDEDLLILTLQDHSFRRAMRICGVKKAELLSRDRNSFREESGKLVSLKIATLRYEHHVVSRKRAIELVVRTLEGLSVEDKKGVGNDPRIFALTLAEQERAYKTKQARKKLENVVLREEKAMEEKRKNLERIRERQERIDQNRSSAYEQKQSDLRNRSLQKAQKSLEMKRRKEVQDNLQLEMIRFRREATKQVSVLAKTNTTQEKLAKNRENRQKCEKEMERRVQEQRRQAEIKLQQKEMLLLEAQRKRAEKAKLEKEKQMLKQKERTAILERLERAKEYKRQAALQKINEASAKAEHLKAVQEKMFRERGQRQRLDVIHKHGWEAEHENAIVLPGPGEYSSAFASPQKCTSKFTSNVFATPNKLNTPPESLPLLSNLVKSEIFEESSRNSPRKDVVETAAVPNKPIPTNEIVHDMMQNDDKQVETLANSDDAACVPTQSNRIADTLRQDRQQGAVQEAAVQDAAEVQDTVSTCSQEQNIVTMSSDDDFEESFGYSSEDTLD